MKQHNLSLTYYVTKITLQHRTLNSHWKLLSSPGRRVGLEDSLKSLALSSRLRLKSPCKPGQLIHSLPCTRDLEELASSPMILPWLLPATWDSAYIPSHLWRNVVSASFERKAKFPVTWLWTILMESKLAYSVPALILVYLNLIMLKHLNAEFVKTQRMWWHVAY